MNLFVRAIATLVAAWVCTMFGMGPAGHAAFANTRFCEPCIQPQSTNRVELVDSEMKKLQGGWQVIKWEDESGQPASADEMKDFILSFEGDVLTMRKGKDDPGTKCQFRIDPAKLPKWIDLGMPAISAGATVLEGIYSLEGDALSLCITSGLVNNAAPPRPTEFKTKPNEKYAVLVLTRIH